jgi:hypothetical protein
VNELAKRTDDLRKQVEANGYDVRDNGKHIVVMGGKEMVSMSRTPSDHRSLKNLESQLRKAGYMKPRPGHVTADGKRAARRAGGKRIAPSKRMRDELKKLLVEMGEDPKYADPSHRGQRGGARAKLIPEMMEAYEECGVESPNDDGGYYVRIKSWLAGDKMYKDQVTVLAHLLAKKVKVDTSKAGEGFQAIVPGKGLTTHWRCKECKAEFETQQGLSVHLLEAHEIAYAPQTHGFFPETATITTSGTTAGYTVTAVPTFGGPTIEVGAQEATNGRVTTLADDLHIQVLAAILDPQVTRDEAVALAQAVYNAVGNH